MAARQSVLIYDRIDANRRHTLLLLGLFAIVLLPAAAWMTEYLMVWLVLVMPLSGLLASENPATGMILLATLALAIVLLAAYLQYRYASALVLRMAGARPVGSGRERDLWRTVENLCIGAGLPQPRVYVVESGAPNAFAAGMEPERASLVVTRGLLQLLDRRELEGVIAHELSHIGNHDTRLSTTVAALAGVLRLPFVVVAGLFRALLRISPIVGAGALLWLGMMLFALLGGVAYLLPYLLSDPSFGPGERALLPLLVGLPLYAFFGAPFLGQLLRLVISRQREFLADADAALLTRYPEGLARALAKIGAASSPRMKVGGATAHLYIANPLSSDAPWWDRIFSTHPPVEERIAILAGMGGGILPSVLHEAEEAGAQFQSTGIPGAVSYDRAGANRLKSLLLLGPFALALWAAAMGLVHPLTPFLGGMNGIIGTAIISVAVFLQYRCASALVLWIAGARPLERADLWRTVEKLSMDAGLPTPGLYVVESAAPNAFAAGLDPERASLVVTRGLLRLLGRQELEGVVAHELSHIRQHDTRLSTVVAALAGALRLLFLVMALPLILLLPFVGGAEFGPIPGSLGSVYGSIGVAAFPLVLYGALAMGIFSLAISREREFLADADAALLTRNPQALARALAKLTAPGGSPTEGGETTDRLDGDEWLSPGARRWQKFFRGATAHLYVVNPLPLYAPWWDRIVRAHPPIEERIARLVTPPES